MIRYARAIRATTIVSTVVVGVIVPARAQPYAQTRPAQAGVPRTSTLPGVPRAPIPYASPESVGLSVAALDSLASEILGWVRENRIVGAEVLIVKNGRIVLHEALGWSDRAANVPLERNTIYRIRSMTKPFTGTSILMLAEQGRLDLGDPVAKYLASWRNEKSREITLRQLLTHTGGFVQGGFPAPFAEFANLRQAVDEVGESGPQHAVGESYVYSDVGSATLGAVVEEISGLPVERFIETRILEPAGLSDTHTGYEVGVPWGARLNPTYSRRTQDGSWSQYWDPSREQVFPFFRASGGLYTTIFDYARWLTCFVDLGRCESFRLVSEETVREALTPGSDGPYGLHWFVYAPPIEDGALPVFGHGGSDGTIAVAFPEEDALALMFTQSRGNDVLGQFMLRVMEMLGHPVPDEGGV